MWRQTLNMKGRYFWPLAVLTAGVIAVLLIGAEYLLAWRTALTVQVARPAACLDPARIAGYEEKLINGALYESLVDYNPEKGTCRGVLAEKWTAGQDGRTYTFYLKKGVRFHNGSPVSAQDVKYSWERVLNPRISGYGYLLQNVAGAEGISEGCCEDVKGLNVVDSHTLRVSLKEPDWTFPAVVSSPALAVVSQKAVQKAGMSYGNPGTSVVGTGPFRLGRWEKDNINLKKNRRYTGAGARLKALRFCVINDKRQVRGLFESGEVDVLAGVPAQFMVSKPQEAKPFYNTLNKPILALYFLGFHLGPEPYGSNPDLRRGLDLALDKQALAGQLLGDGGKALTRFLPPELISPGEKKGEKPVFNRDDALGTLAHAGFPYGLHLPPLTFAYNDSPGHESLARLVQEQLGQVGIDVDLKKLAWSAYRKELLTGDYALFRLGWEADYPEPGNLLYNNFAGGGKSGGNLTGYNNSEFDALMKQARLEKDHARRREIYRQAEEKMLADAPIIPLFQRVTTFYLQKEIEGFDVDLLGRVDFTRIKKS